MRAMTNPIDRRFASLRAAGRKAFIPFLPAGDPSLDATGRLVGEVVQRGADLVEIGFPYSDPLADGPVIQASYTRALRAGTRLEGIFAAAPSWSAADPAVPLVGMVAYSIIFRRGVAVFLDRAKQAGFAGLIVPDLPVDEAADLATAASDRDLKLIQLVTPTTPRDRAARVAALSSGFLYVVCVTGITGARAALPETLGEQLTWLRTVTDLPLCVGFGVSQPEHARLVRPFADGVIVGSALVRHLERAAGGSLNDAVSAAGDLVAVLRRALDAP
jgi:tryptophan synthase alpha chain